MSGRVELSDGERALFAALGQAELAQHIDQGLVPVLRGYSSLVEHTFVSGTTHPAADALRRVMRVVGGPPYRGTPEFEKLLEF